MTVSHHNSSLLSSSDFKERRCSARGINLMSHSSAQVNFFVRKWLLLLPKLRYAAKNDLPTSFKHGKIKVMGLNGGSGWREEDSLNHQIE